MENFVNIKNYQLKSVNKNFSCVLTEFLCFLCFSLFLYNSLKFKSISQEKQ